MIEVFGVKATRRELRPIQKGWGSIHWLSGLPLLVPFAGLFAIVLAGSDVLPWQLTIGVWLGSILIWFLVKHLVGQATMRASHRSPTGAIPNDWQLDGSGFRCSMPVATSSFDWEAVKDVIEEVDRFIFLLTPQANPVLPKRCVTPEQIDALRALVADVRASGRLGRGVD